MSNSCLFCGAKGAGVLTNEHVIPRWLLEHLGLPDNDHLFQGVASSATETLVEQPRIHSSFNFVQGRICENCNTGWMSRLEGTAKPILVPLIEKERMIDSLSLEEADVVGKWASKFAFETARSARSSQNALWRRRQARGRHSCVRNAV